MKYLNFLLIFTLISFTISARVSLRKSELESFQVEIFDLDGKIFMDATNLLDGTKYKSARLYESLDRAFVDEHIGENMELQGVEEKTIYIKPPMLQQAEPLQELEQTDDQKRFNLMEIENQRLKKDLEDLIKRVLILESKQTEIGSYQFGRGNSTSYNIGSGEGERNQQLFVQFDKPFPGIPKVVVSLGGLSLHSGDVRVSTKIDSIRQDGFDFTVRTWGDTQWNGINTDWIAYYGGETI